MTENLNPNEYGYLPTSEIRLTAKEYITFCQAIEAALEKETKYYFAEKYKTVDENGKTVKPGSKNKSPKSIVDIEKTMTVSPTIYRTTDGMHLLQVKQMIEEIHYRNIQEGVAQKITPSEK